MKLLDEKDMLFSYFIEKKSLLPHNLKEQENDLVGNYFDIYRKAPRYRFGKQPVKFLSLKENVQNIVKS